MSTETTISRPAPFVEDLGKDLAKQAVALTGVTCCIRWYWKFIKTNR
jgi:hypothetical protein